MDFRKYSRRVTLKSLLLGAAATATAAVDERGHGDSTPSPRWARGFKGQRKAYLGDGTFLNPILAGDHPDPSILKDGEDYFLTCSSFDSYPGLVIRKSRDLV